MSTNWLTARAWLDEDGKHVWFKHDCQGHWLTSMLPYSTWHASADGKRLEPSVNCTVCGLHAWFDLSEAPNDDR